MKKIIFFLLLFFTFLPIFITPVFAASLLVSPNPGKASDTISMTLTGCPSEYTKNTLGALFQWKFTQNNRYEYGRAAFSADGNATLSRQFQTGTYDIRADCADKHEFNEAQLHTPVALDDTATLSIQDKTGGSCSYENGICADDSQCTSKPGCGDYRCRVDNQMSSKMQCVHKDKPAPTPMQPPGTDGPAAGSTNGQGDGTTSNCDTGTGDIHTPCFRFNAPSYLPKYSNRAAIINSFLALFLSLISILAIGLLIWGGIEWILSEGDKQKMQSARGRITYAIIGLIVAFSSFFLIQIIGHIFSVELLINLF